MTARRTVAYPPGEALRALHRARGEAVVLPGPRPVVYLFGPAANEFVFAHDELFRWREAFKALIPVDGETALIVSDGADHARRRALVRPGLHHRQVASSVQIMGRSADEALTGTRRGEPFDAYALLRAAIRRSTMRSLFGMRVAAHEDQVGADLQPLFDLTDRLQTMPLHERLRTPLWRKAMAARTRIDVFVADQIEQARRESPDEVGAPMLAMLVHGRDGSGSGLSDTEIRDQMVSLIAAGYETTSAAMAWSIYGLGGRPDLLAQAREQVLSMCGHDLPTADQLGELTLVSAVVTEALRLWPPAVISARWVATPTSYAGRRIPAGALLCFSPYVTHRDSRIYDRAAEFRPERWLDRPKRPAGEFLPFGGGAHRCIGSTMATTELTVMLARLLARAPYDLVPTRVRPTSMAAMRPRAGMPIVQR